MDVRFRPRGTGVVALALAFVMAASGCSAAATPSPEPTKAPTAAPSTAASAAPSPTIDVLAPYASKSGTLPLIKFATSVPQMSFAPFEIAKLMNFFEYQGVKTDFVQLQSGATALQAIQGGSIDLLDSASTEVVGGVGQGLDFQAIQNTVMMTLQFCVSKDWAAKANVTATSTIQQKMAAMKGATIAITGPGAVSDKGARWLLKKYGGLNADIDTKIVQVGGAAAMPGALDADQVQAFLLSPPACGRTKNGMILLEPSAVPEFANYVHEVLYGKKSWLTAHKAEAKAVATAISMGNNYILKYPAAALTLLKRVFNKVDPAVVEVSFNNTIKPQVKADGKMDEAMWKSTTAMQLEAGIISKPIDTAEGTMWTNEYIGDASLK
jgi:ABC-type nitrate/sulfonate/bicarbonate transport system substrate-binding protein